MDNLKNYQYTMESCNHCGQCKFLLSPKASGWDFADVCPIYHRFGFDAYSGQGLIHIAKEVMNGKIGYGDGLDEMIFTCTACGACDVNCKNVRDMELLDTIYALREDCAKNGTIPAKYTEAAENVKTAHNIYGRDHADRFAWIPADYKDDEDADTALFIGCAAAYRYPSTALAAIRILKAAGVKFKLLYEDEWCCGAALWRSGQCEAAAEQAAHNMDAFHRHGIRTVITTCAECFGALRGGYPRFVEMDVQVRHISEVAAECIKNGSLKLRGDHAPLKVTYHDPCMLGRLSEPYVPWNGEIRAFGLCVPEKQWRRGEHGVYQAPRDILDAIPGIETVEMVRNLEDSYCCGNGAGASGEILKWASAERRREAKACGAEAIVSCCPFCRDALEAEGENALPYLELTELLAEML